MTVSLSKDGRIFLGLDNQRLRGRLFGAENELKASVEVPKERLADMLIQARTANPRLRTVIKGDMETEYGVVEDVIEILQKTRINRFNLVTNLERPEGTP
jgi:biopolymer transport protein ExbD